MLSFFNFREKTQNVFISDKIIGNKNIKNQGFHSERLYKERIMLKEIKIIKNICVISSKHTRRHACTSNMILIF